MVARRLCDSHQRRVSFLFKAYPVFLHANHINHNTDVRIPIQIQESRDSKGEQYKEVKSK